MDARTLLSKLRHQQAPSAGELVWAAGALADGTLSDAQAGALAMAICLNGLDGPGRVALTLAMRDSGDVLGWDLGGPVLDKHSTGGVGDCVSLVLAPALAACGAYVPMISGRGLGHTGGTLDKLEAVPGVSTQCDTPQLRAMVGQIGCAIVGASAQIAPADRRLYAVRDVTGTVDSIDLITASILSKKLAAGLDGLVLDVKLGSGAFMKDPAAARQLAQSLCETASAAGCPATALITDMSEPAAPAIGNALEMVEAMHTLSGAARGTLSQLSCALGGALLAQGGLAQDPEAGEQMIARAIASGAALDRFARMIAALGGPRDFDNRWVDHLPQAPVVHAVPSLTSGVVCSMDGQALGLAGIALGAGRQVETDRINPATGLSRICRLGSAIEVGQPLAFVHAANDTAAQQAAGMVQRAIALGPRPPQAQPLIVERISG